MHQKGAAARDVTNLSGRFYQGGFGFRFFGLRIAMSSRRSNGKGLPDAIRR